MFPIYRVEYQEPTSQLLASVEVGQYGAGNEIARDLFEIERYERVEQRGLHQAAPAEYSLSKWKWNWPENQCFKL